MYLYEIKIALLLQHDTQIRLALLVPSLNILFIFFFLFNIHHVLLSFCRAIAALEKLSRRTE